MAPTETTGLTENPTPYTCKHVFLSWSVFVGEGQEEPSHDDFSHAFSCPARYECGVRKKSVMKLQRLLAIDRVGCPVASVFKAISTVDGLDADEYLTPKREMSAQVL